MALFQLRKYPVNAPAYSGTSPLLPDLRCGGTGFSREGFAKIENAVDLVHRGVWFAGEPRSARVPCHN